MSAMFGAHRPRYNQIKTLPPFSLGTGELWRPEELKRSSAAAPCCDARAARGTGPRHPQRLRAWLTAVFIFSRPALATSAASMPQYFRLNNSSDSTFWPPMERKARRISTRSGALFQSPPGGFAAGRY